jgi:hypothetical protein
MDVFGMDTRGAVVQNCHPLEENSGRTKLLLTGNVTREFAALFEKGDGQC